MAIRRAAAARRGASTTPEESPGGTGPEAVRVCLLGGFRVRVGDRAVGSGGWRLKKAASLVKILSLSKDHRLHREQETGTSLTLLPSPRRPPRWATEGAQEGTERRSGWWRRWCGG